MLKSKEPVSSVDVIPTVTLPERRKDSIRFMRLCLNFPRVPSIALVLVTLFLKEIGIHFLGPEGHLCVATWTLKAMTQRQGLLWIVR